MSTLKVAAVQYDIKWLDKQANFATLENMIGDYFEHHDAVDLLLLPETFSTGFCVDNSSVQEPEDGGVDLLWLKKVAKAYNCVVAGTVLVAVLTGGVNKKANRFYWAKPDGSVEFYDKRHLFRLGNEGEFVAQGEVRKIIEINGIRILPQVCYDLRFPVWSRNRQDYDLMINVANWPAARRHVWDTLLKARAMENQAYVIGINRVGDDGLGVSHSGGTCFVDFVGESLVTAEDDRQQVISYELNFSELEKFKQGFPAFLDADEFEIG
jgi:predicted amidohydrolase